MRKPCKIIKKSDEMGIPMSEINIYGNHHWKEIEYDIPEWLEEENDSDFKACFTYLGHKYFLSEIMRVDKNNPFYEYGFDGYMSDSFFSGVLVKFSDDYEAVQAYSYIS